MPYVAHLHRAFVVAVIIAAAVIPGCTQQNEYKPPPPPKVTVANPIRQTVTSYLVETGTTEAVRQAEVRVRVTGFLEEILFEPGEDVHAGDVLYVIQQREFKAKLDAARAELDARKVDLERAEIEFQRETSLQTENATSERKVVLAKAERDAAAAAVAAASANLELAQKDMDDTQVRALIDGRVGKTLVKVGNLVEGPAGTQLTEIVQYNPIYANFNISEAQLLELRDRARNTQGDIEKSKLDAKLFLQRINDEGFPYEGHFDYADLAVDQSTGTFMVRGIFPNPKLDIIPGLFVRIQIPLGTIDNALLVPESAIGSDQRGSYLLIVQDNKVERRNVTLGMRHQGNVVISSGITASDQVIVEGLQRARPGSEVDPEKTILAEPDVKVVTKGSLGPAEPEAGETSDGTGVSKDTVPAESALEKPEKATPSANADPASSTKE